MSETQEMSETQKLASALPAYALLFVLFFLVAWGVTALAMNWDKALALFVESHQEKYDVMTGQVGPTTFLVLHDGILEQLQSLAKSDPEILGVEQDPLGTVARIAFTSIESGSIEMVRQLPGVTGMINRNVPMICH